MFSHLLNYPGDLTVRKELYRTNFVPTENIDQHQSRKPAIVGHMSRDMTKPAE